MTTLADIKDREFIALASCFGLKGKSVQFIRRDPIKKAVLSRNKKGRFTRRYVVVGYKAKLYIPATHKHKYLPIETPCIKIGVGHMQLNN